MKEAARRARGDVLASIVCSLLLERAAPVWHIRNTSLFLESYIIPKMLMNGWIIVKMIKKAIRFTLSLHTTKKYLHFASLFLWVFLFCRRSFRKNSKGFLVFGILENNSQTEYKTSKDKRRIFGTFSHKSKENIFVTFYSKIDKNLSCKKVFLRNEKMKILK